MGIAITTRPLQFPGFGDLQGTIKIFLVLRKPAWSLCTFVGHRGTENKIPPQTIQTDNMNLFCNSCLISLISFYSQIALSVTC